MQFFCVYDLFSPAKIQNCRMQLTKIAKNCKLYFAKIGESCRVEVAKTRKSPRKVCLLCVSFFFYLLQFEKMLYFCPMKKSTQSIA